MDLILAELIWAITKGDKKTVETISGILDSDLGIRLAADLVISVTARPFKRIPMPDLPGSTPLWILNQRFTRKEHAHV